MTDSDRTHVVTASSRRRAGGSIPTSDRLATSKNIGRPHSRNTLGPVCRVGLAIQVSYQKLSLKRILLP